MTALVILAFFSAEILRPMLPTGTRLDPAGRCVAVGNMPLNMRSAGLDLCWGIRDDVLLNRVLWMTIKGDAPYPCPRRATTLELLDARP